MRDIDLLEKLCGYKTGDYATDEARRDAMRALAIWTPMDLISALQIAHLNGIIEIQSTLIDVSERDRVRALQERHRVLRRQQSGLSLRKEATE